MQSISKIDNTLSHQPALLKATTHGLLDDKFFEKRLRKSNQIIADRKFISLTSGIFVDGTFGRGGHSKELLKYLGNKSRLFVFDKDPEAILSANFLSQKDNRVTAIHSNFSSMQEALALYNVRSVDGIILDLGISSPQVEDQDRGFSFMRDGPLDMRMDITSGITVGEWLANANVEEIRRVLREYGEERFSFQIAKEIVAYRKVKPFQKTFELAKCVSKVVKTRKKNKHPATRTFQAFRIYINNELKELESVLPIALKLLKPGGRLATISFHSLEDRIIKRYISAMANPRNFFSRRLTFREDEFPKPFLYLLGRIFASKEDIFRNPRERSAILRIAQRSSNKFFEIQEYFDNTSNLGK